VQQALLKILEGSRVSVAAQHSKKHNSKDTVEINTAEILFICGGAFVGLEQQIAARLQQHAPKVGFGAELAVDVQVTHSDVTVRDLISYGMIPEFVSRFGMITHVDALTEQQLVRVLKEPKHNLIAQYQYLFELDGIELKFEESALAAIAQRAIAQEINARGLRSILETILLPYQFDAVDLNTRGLTRITITRDTVHGSPALLTFANQKSVRST
jgi:ATP-dependent Clp protease ATP-binding subunit ClpX